MTGTSGNDLSQSNIPTSLAGFTNIRMDWSPSSWRLKPVAQV